MTSKTSGGSRGGPPFWGKEEEITEVKQAGTTLVLVCKPFHMLRTAD